MTTPTQAGRAPDEGLRELVPAASPVEASPMPLRVEAVYYTDPLCCWSWAFEPQWRRLRYEFGDQLAWRYRMGGLIRDWTSFHDPINDINRPAQMAPHWWHVADLTGVPINERIWHEDPPDSSYPACIAFKAAERQGHAFAEAYLRRLREAVMLERRNIAQGPELVAQAEETTERHPEVEFDIERFVQDLNSAVVRDAFRDDLRDAAYVPIGRFPSLILRGPAGRSLLITGHRPYPVLRSALSEVAPQVPSLGREADLQRFAERWKTVTPQEVAEALQTDPQAARDVLEQSTARGEFVSLNSGRLFRLAR